MVPLSVVIRECDLTLESGWFRCVWRKKLQKRNMAQRYVSPSHPPLPRLTWIRNMPCRVKVKAKRKVPTHPSLKKMNPKIPNQRKAKVGKERVKLVNQTVWTMIQTLQWLRV